MGLEQYSFFSFLLLFFLSVVANWVLILQARQLPLLRRQSEDRNAIQSCHTDQTPRVGGVALGLGLLASLFFMPSDLREDCFLLMISVLPLFAAGLSEDLGFRVSPKWRLIAAGISSLLAILLLGTWVTRVDVPVVDLALVFAPLAIAFTVFATAGLSHAFNLIDGLNGLAATVACAAAIGLISIAELSGNTQFVQSRFMLLAVLVGFLVFNFPRGKIFLGDAGAYTLGHLLAWSAILLVATDDRIAAWSIMLVFFWPVADTFLAMYRRKKAGLELRQPDNMHIHHVVLQSLEVVSKGRLSRQLTNPLTTLLMMPMIVLPVGLGVLLWDQPLSAFVAFVAMSMAFCVTYFGLKRLTKSKSPTCSSIEA